MDKINYVQAVSRLKVLETRLLDKGKINRMIESANAEDSLKILNESEYANYLNNIKSPLDYEVILSKELKKSYELIYKITPEKGIIDIISMKYDYHNLKVLLKGKYLKKDLTYLLVDVGTVDVELLKKYIEDDFYSDMSPIMREAVEKTLNVFESSKDPQKIDIILDNYLYKDMMSKALSLGEEYLIKFVKIQIDLNNIKTLLRVKKQNKDREFLRDVINEGGNIDKDVFIDYLNDSIENFANRIYYTDYGVLLKDSIDTISKNNDFTVLEKMSDNFMMDYIKKAKYVSFGPEPILAYIFAKEAEIRAIRTIMVGKLNNIASDIIRERLRDIYV